MPDDPAVAPDPPGAAAFFDLDKTLVAGSSALAFRRPFRRHGLITRRAAVRTVLAQLMLALTGADAATMTALRARMAQLVVGWEVERVRAVVAGSLHDIVVPLIYTEALELVARHRAAGDEVIVLSASAAELVEPIAALIGVDHVVCSRMVVVDGRYTGEIDYYCYGAAKAAAATAIATERGHRLAECHAYSDSITDLPLLQVVGHPAAVNPDRALRREARRRGWPVRRHRRHAECL